MLTLDKEDRTFVSYLAVMVGVSFSFFMMSLRMTVVILQVLPLPGFLGRMGSSGFALAKARM
jgi:hypothetical protein